MLLLLLELFYTRLRKWLKNKFPQFDLRLDKCQKPEHYLKLHDDLMDYAGQYFINSDRPDKMPNDPVARFHLGNGASLEQINFLGDTSANGISLSGGLMVNYLYDLENCLLYTSPSPRDVEESRMPSSA